MKYLEKIAKINPTILANKVNALNYRERILLGSTVLVGVYFLWQAIIFSGLSFMLHGVESSMKENSREIALLNKNIENLKNQSKENTIPVLKKQLSSLTDQLSDLKKELSGITNSWLSARDMIALLQKMLEGKDNIEILKLDSIAIKPLFEDMPETLKNQTKLFKRGLAIELQSGYFEVMNFLNTLSQFSQAVLWDELLYEVQDYPKAKVKLVVYTLSTEEGWIGV